LEDENFYVNNSRLSRSPVVLSTEDTLKAMCTYKFILTGINKEEGFADPKSCYSQLLKIIAIDFMS
jgi:hypothetical protein